MTTTPPDQPQEGAGGSPQSPAPGQPPAQGPQSPAQPYGGQVPPGGWDRPVPESPVGSMRLAGYGARVGAFLLDGLIVSVPALIIMAVLGFGIVASSEGDSDAGVAAFIGGLLLAVLVFVVVAFLYAPLLMRRAGEHNGQTLGKQVVNIRVVRTNGRPMDFGAAALREIVLKGLAVGIASSIIPFIPFLVNYLWPLWDEENRALHDMAASTRVVAA